MRKFPPGEYTAGRGTPARTHLGENKKLSPGERARVERIRAHEAGGLEDRTDLDGSARKAAESAVDSKTNLYGREEDLSEEI